MGNLLPSMIYLKGKECTVSKKKIADNSPEQENCGPTRRSRLTPAVLAFRCQNTPSNEPLLRLIDGGLARILARRMAYDLGAKALPPGLEEPVR